MAAALNQFSTNPIRPSLTIKSLKRPSSFPTKVTMLNKTSYWSTINSDLDTHLSHTLPIRDPLVVHQPIHDLVFSAPKTMAPALCIAACELVGGHRADAIATAAALNLMLAASYTHQHLPNLLQRQDPSTFPHNIELLAGDAISPLGFELLARPDGRSGNSEQVLRVIVEMARVMGGKGMVEGQYLHAKMGKGTEGEDEMLRQVCEKKVGMVYACGAACGAIVGGGSEEEVEKLRRFGFYVGMIYGVLDGFGSEGNVEGFRCLAMKELEGFEVGKVGTISSLVDGI